MKASWPKVRLGEVLRQAERAEAVDPSKLYQLLGVRWYGQGLFLREEKLGANIAANRLYLVKPGDFVYNRLFAWKGSFAVAGAEASKAYVSNEFPCFTTDATRLNAHFLFWFFRQERTWTEVLGLSTGATPTSRNRLGESLFLAMEVPLPPLAEQRRVVGRIEELATRIHEAWTLRKKAVDEVETLARAYLRSAILDCRGDEGELEGVCETIIDNLHSNPIYAPSGVPCVRSSDVGWGTLNLATALRTDEAEYLRRTARGEPQADDIVFVREGGGTGKCALVLPDQRFSLGQRVMILRLNRKKIVPSFFLYQLLSPLVQESQIQPLCKGSASPHLNIGVMRRFRIRVPPVPEQHRMVADVDALQAEAGQVKRLQAETAAQFDTLVPALLDRAFKGQL